MKKTRQPAPEGLIELQRRNGASWVPMSRDYDRIVMDTRFEYARAFGSARLVDLHTGEVLKEH